jgi:hypothetical protein
MSAEAAKWVAKFAEGVINAVDGDGYPLSVRQTSLAYDAATGTMKLTMPESLGAVAGPASLLCHFHDDDMWKLRAILLKGQIERRDGAWVFVTASFEPPSMRKMMKNIGVSWKAYLEKRGLPVPKVDYAVIDEMWREVKARPR